MQPLPNARLLPLVEAPVAGRARAEAELERQMPPGDPGVQHEQDPLQRLPVRQPLATRENGTAAPPAASSGSTRCHSASDTTHGATATGTPSSLTTGADGFATATAVPSHLQIRRPLFFVPTTPRLRHTARRAARHFASSS